MHAQWELTQAAERAATCAKCPATGGACEGEAGYYAEGLQPVWHQGSLMPTTCDRWLPYSKRRKLAASGVPPAMLDVSFETYEPYNKTQGQALNVCEGYASTALRTARLMISGPTGVGKTHLGASCLQVLCTGASVMFAYVPDFIDQIRRESLHLGDTTTLERACNVDFLLLDDLGAERTTDFVREKLEVLLNTRLLYRRAVLFTQNLSMEDLSAGLGSPLARRVMQDTTVVEIEGVEHEPEE